MRNKRNNMRGDGGGQRRGGGGRRYHNNSGRSSGQNDSQNLQRQKHHATQQLGKYNDLARNAQMGGDRVDVEYYLQHVDHYTRVLADIAVIEAERYAHHRDQFAQQQEGHAPTENTEQNANDVDGTSQEQGDTGYQPRRQRHHQRQRQSHYSPPLEERVANADSDESATTSGTGGSSEIPLPNLPAI